MANLIVFYVQARASARDEQICHLHSMVDHICRQAWSPYNEVFLETYSAPTQSPLFSPDAPEEATHRIVTPWSGGLGGAKHTGEPMALALLLLMHPAVEKVWRGSQETFADEVTITDLADEIVTIHGYRRGRDG